MTRFSPRSLKQNSTYKPGAQQEENIVGTQPVSEGLTGHPQCRGTTWEPVTCLDEGPDTNSVMELPDPMCSQGTKSTPPWGQGCQ